jgi:5-amino-6-(5-phospho-D-ribitylamino)uracil phosphatase
MRPRLYISDLDGTLLGADRRLGERTRRVLARFIAGGGLFTVATGRSAASCASTLAGLRLPVPAITHNGALISDLQPADVSGAPPAQVARPVRAMPGRLAADLFALAIRRGLAPVAYGLDETERTWLLHPSEANSPTRRYLDSLSLLHPRTVDDGTRLSDLRGLSLILLDDPVRLAEFLAEACGPGSGFACSLGRSAYTIGLGVGEVQSEEANKGAAAVELCRSLGLAAADIVAFGDNSNDLPLLGVAGEAFCPPDAQPEVLAATRGRIACAAEEGVAAFLEARLDRVAAMPQR